MRRELTFLSCTIGHLYSENEKKPGFCPFEVGFWFFQSINFLNPSTYFTAGVNADLKIGFRAQINNRHSKRQKFELIKIFRQKKYLPIRSSPSSYFDKIIGHFFNRTFCLPLHLFPSRITIIQGL